MSKKNEGKSSFIGFNKDQIKFKILGVDRGIPIPKPLIRYKRKSKYPFDRMKIGDSFLVKPPKGLPPIRRTIIAGSIVSCGRVKSKGKRKYLYRILKNKSIRIWRVK